MQQQIDELLHSPAGDQFFATALRELKEGSHDRAVFARAIADAGGDDAAIHAQYLRLRTQRLAAEHLARLPPVITTPVNQASVSARMHYEQLSHTVKSAIWQDFLRQYPQLAAAHDSGRHWRGYLSNLGYILPN